MSDTRIITYQAKGKNHPDNVANVAADTLLDVNKGDGPVREKDAFKGDVSSIVRRNDIYITGMIQQLKPSFYTPKRSDLPFKGYIITPLMSVSDPIMEPPKGEKEQSFYNQLNERGGHVFGYACNNEQEKLPPYVHITERIRETLEEKVHKKDPEAVVIVFCTYDIDNDRVDRIGIKTNVTESGVNVSPTNMFKNNDFGFDEKILGRIQNAELNVGDEENVRTYTLTEHYFSPINRRHNYGITRAKHPYGPYFKGEQFAGRDIGSPERGGSYLARYIAKNIIATGKFDEVEVYLNYLPVIGEDIEPNIFVKAKMFGSAEVEFNFPQHFIEDLYGIFPTKLKDARQTFYDPNEPFFYQELSLHGDIGKDRPWEKTDKVDQVDDIRI